MHGHQGTRLRTFIAGRCSAGAIDLGRTWRLLVLLHQPLLDFLTEFAPDLAGGVFDLVERAGLLRELFVEFSAHLFDHFGDEGIAFWG
jgi:hypothetical protein